jgi:hypothetical protein
VRPTSGVLGQCDEARLQNLIHSTPACLPISEIKLDLGRFMPICRHFRRRTVTSTTSLMLPAGVIAMVEKRLQSIDWFARPRFMLVEIEPSALDVAAHQVNSAVF